MLELEEALARIFARLPGAKNECVPLRDARRRITTEPVTASIDLPVFDNSSMDGYAVRAADVAGASAENPARVRLICRVPAGEVSKIHLAAGECVRLFTGSPLPDGADAVVMQEDTRICSTNPDQILVTDSVKPWENVRFRGEDVKRGARLVEAGEILTPGHIALLAATGVVEVKVGRRPIVALIATGSELQEPGQPLAPGQIYESNRSALSPLIEDAGGIVKLFPIVPDEPATTESVLKKALEECDIVITCGGVSVGELDFVKASFEKLGGTLDFWKVSIKPGRPFVFGQRGKKFLFGLPGNPVSAFVTFLMLARPALIRWQGGDQLSLPKHPGILTEPLANPGGRRHFMRVRVDGLGQVRSAGIQASHILSSTAAANGLLDVPPQTTLPVGTEVEVMRWD